MRVNDVFEWDNLCIIVYLGVKHVKSNLPTIPKKFHIFVRSVRDRPGFFTVGGA